jgi:four helix bundle protein
MRLQGRLVRMMGRVHAIARTVGRKDAGLAKQMRESSSSVALNFGEGIWARGGNRTTRLDTSLNSARETVVALLCAQEAGYAPAASVQPELHELDECIAQLWVLTHRPTR